MTIQTNIQSIFNLNPVILPML